MKRRHTGTRSEGQETGFIVVYLSKTNIKSAFRVLLLNKKCWCWLVMMAKNPLTGKWQFFVDKCLLFGSSISCSHFQRVSNALKLIVKTKTHSPLTNYLDDFLFYALTHVGGVIS